MPEHRTGKALSERGTHQLRFALPAGLLSALAVAVLALLGIGVRYFALGELNVIYSLLSVFFSANLLICYWEVCLFLRRDYIETRSEYWRDWKNMTGRTPHREFLTTKVPLAQVLSPTVWADVWATYSQFDTSYTDRRTFGFHADIGNGFVTPAPTLILYASYALNLVPAVLAGIVGVMVFWQWTYVTSVYWVSFFVANRQARITRRELYAYIWGTNSPWVLFALLGLFVSVRLILDGNYSVLSN